MDLHAEGDDGEEDEDSEGDDLLYDLELHEVEGASVALEAEADGGHLQAILEEGDVPGKGDDGDERQRFEPTELLHLEMSVPR